MKSGNILIVDDDRDVLETAKMFLKQEFTNVTIEDKPENIPHQLDRQDFDVILLDMNFNRGLNDGEEGFQWLNQILQIDPQAVVILSMDVVRDGASHRHPAGTGHHGKAPAARDHEVQDLRESYA